MIEQLTQFILPAWRAPRTCEACGQPFQCGASLKGCWCSNVKLDEAARQRLRAQYRACLCQTCLESFVHPEPEDKE